MVFCDAGRLVHRAGLPSQFPQEAFPAVSWLPPGPVYYYVSASEELRYPLIIRLFAEALSS